METGRLLTTSGMQNLSPIQEAILAILLAAGAPVDRSRLGSILSEFHPGVRWEAALEELCAYGYGPLQVLWTNSGCHLRIHARHSALLASLELQKPRPLSRAALETLAVIAYHQPVTRPEIEHWRGVSVSSGILQQLQDLQWIGTAGTRDSPGRPALWTTTPEFLQHFGLPDLGALPPTGLSSPESTT